LVDVVHKLMFNVGTCKQLHAEWSCPVWEHTTTSWSGACHPEFFKI